ncbi:hypothetical protein TSACC_2816 [Terrimicrobium sacchariphilum]|uniref:Uncharacterized protein n=1 Tax=Terrimicrobium sacchariphilum TaxID=690879 RepID=A0A146G6K3_TERSA|nr:hypothetical protein [Terrimicrobium sacchariphilum]GAT32418.1 hypothetical protein TSACC_2816 [Terrimicrobium sacchariphilum]
MKTFLLLCALLAAGLPDFWMPDTDKVPLKFPGQFPVHPVTEFFLKHLSNGQEAFARPTPSFFSKKSWPIFFGQYMSYDPPFPTAELDFIGSDAAGDHYAVSFQADAASPVVKKEVVYTGTLLEVCKDERYALGIRPQAKANESK